MHQRNHGQCWLLTRQIRNQCLRIRPHRRARNAVLTKLTTARPNSPSQHTRAPEQGRNPKPHLLRQQPPHRTASHHSHTRHSTAHLHTASNAPTSGRRSCSTPGRRQQQPGMQMQDADAGAGNGWGVESHADRLCAGNPSTASATVPCKYTAGNLHWQRTLVAKAHLNRLSRRERRSSLHKSPPRTLRMELELSQPGLSALHHRHLVIWTLPVAALHFHSYLNNFSQSKWHMGFESFSTSVTLCVE
jgi:hypothetical protein